MRRRSSGRPPPPRLRKNKSDQGAPSRMPAAPAKFKRARSTEKAAIPFDIGSTDDRLLLVSAIVHTCVRQELALALC